MSTATAVRRHSLGRRHPHCLPSLALPIFLARLSFYRQLSPGTIMTVQLDASGGRYLLGGSGSDV